MGEGKKDKLIWIILITAGIIYLAWMFVIPFNHAPDENNRYLVPQFIFENGYLPQGREESIRIPGWGFSYALTPILASIANSIFMKVYSMMGGSIEKMYLAARLFSVCCGIGTVYFTIKIGEETVGSKYKYLLASCVGFLPQFTFLSSYINNDVLAVFAISIIIYYWLEGSKYGWRIKQCIGLAIGIGICALSYYNAYGFILCSIILFFISNRLMKVEWKVVLKRAALISSIVFILSGWWFIRSYCIHNGDVLGLRSITEYGNLYGAVELQKANRNTSYNLGESLLYMLKDRHWIYFTYESFIGGFDNMTLYVYKWIYIFYGILMALGGVKILTMFRKDKVENENNEQKLKQNRLFQLMLILASAISIILSLIYSYYTDFQPQGRYIMGCLIPIMYFVTLEIKKIDKWFINHNIDLKLPYILSGIVVVINIICLTRIVFPAYFVVMPIY